MKTSHLIPLCAVLLAASVTAGHAQAPPGNWCGDDPGPTGGFPQPRLQRQHGRRHRRDQPEPGGGGAARPGVAAELARRQVGRCRERAGRNDGGQLIGHVTAHAVSVGRSLCHSDIRDAIRSQRPTFHRADRLKRGRKPRRAHRLRVRERAVPQATCFQTRQARPIPGFYSCASSVATSVLLAGGGFDPRRGGEYVILIIILRRFLNAILRIDQSRQLVGLRSRRELVRPPNDLSLALGVSMPLY